MDKECFPASLQMMLHEVDQVPYFTFPKLDQCEGILHLQTTREGGVSSGQFRSMNFSVKLGDRPENVRKNYEIIAGLLEGTIEDIVGTVQTHTTNIRRVTAKDRGKAICFPPDYGDVDGLVTNEPGVILAAFTADCVPIYFADPENGAIGLAHSGWRGTVQNMAGKMVARMAEEFGTKPSKVIAAIGPSICQKCYEVDEVVAESFRNALGEAVEERLRIKESGSYPMEASYGLRNYLEPGRQPGKYQLDLWLSNLIFLTRAGVLPEKVDVTDLCTAENSKFLFSHRATMGKRGNMGSFIKLKQKE